LANFQEGSHAASGAAFGDTNAKITTDGRPYLGSPFGIGEFVISFIVNKVEEWFVK